MKTWIIKEMIQTGTKPKRCIRKIKTTDEKIFEEFKKEVEESLIVETIEIEEYEEED